MENKNTYDVFTEKLVEQLGFRDVAEPQKSKLIDAIRQRVEARVLRVLATSLTDEQNKELSEKVKQENLDEAAIVDYLAKNAPNASTAIARALEDLYMEMKEETDTLMQVATIETVSRQSTPQVPYQPGSATKAPQSGELHTRVQNATNTPTDNVPGAPPVNSQYY